MGRKAKASPDLVTTWTVSLSEASEALRKKRDEAVRAEELLRVIVRDAFDAGLTVDPISEATGLSIGRLYQINRGVRK